MHDSSCLHFSHMTERGTSVSGLPGFKRTRTLLGIQRIGNSRGRLVFHALDDLRGYSLNAPQRRNFCLA